MKYGWTEKDVRAGRYVCKEPPEVLKTAEQFAALAMTTCKIGYNGGGEAMCLIAMTDGAIITTCSKERMAAMLNEQEYMPMPHRWLMGVMDAMRGWYEE